MENYSSIDLSSINNSRTTSAVQILRKGHVSVVFGGNTRPFRQLFENEGIGGKNGPPQAGSIYPEYYRIMPEINVGLEETRRDFLAILSNKVLLQTPVCFRWRSMPIEDPSIESFRSELLALPNVIERPWPATA